MMAALLIYTRHPVVVEIEEHLLFQVGLKEELVLVMNKQYLLVEMMQMRQVFLLFISLLMIE
jgi:hypothetical protein